MLIDFYGTSGRLPSPFMPKSVPAAPWDVELLVFISIQCFFGDFIRETFPVFVNCGERPETQQNLGHALIVFMLSLPLSEVFVFH